MANYRFGDYTRWLAGAERDEVVAARRGRNASPCKSWKQSSGRSDGEDTYQLGDIGRSLLKSAVDSALFPSIHHTPTYQSLEDLSEHCPGAEVFYVHDRVPCICVPATEEFPRRATCAVIFFKGNGYDLGSAIPELVRLADAFKAPIFAPEYPGYGALARSSPSADVVNAIADAISQCVVERGFSEVFIAGRSLGCGPAVRLCAAAIQDSDALDVVGLVTFSGWSNFKSLSMATAFCDERWDSLSLAPSVSVPWCIIHGDADSLVPFRCAEQLCAAAPEATLIQVPGARHSCDALLRSGYAAISEFAALLWEDEHSGVDSTGTSAPAPTPAQAYANAYSHRVLFCHGFNTTKTEVAHRASLVQELALKFDANVDVVTAAWTSRAAEAREQGAAALLAAPMYLTDNTRTVHGIGTTIPKSGRFSIVAHSRGCHVVVKWLHQNPHRWVDIERVALCHPDVPRVEFGDRLAFARTEPGRSFSNRFAARISDILTPENLFSQFARAKIGVFDAANDHATSVSGGLFGTTFGSGSSRCIGDLCHFHQRADGMSHSLWLDDKRKLEEVMDWLLRK